MTSPRITSPGTGLVAQQRGECITEQELLAERENPTTLVLREVEDERHRQDAKWGGPAHDDAHDSIEWDDFIRMRTRQLARVDLPDRRRLLVEIAALSAAAIESYDRKAGAK